MKLFTGSSTGTSSKSWMGEGEGFGSRKWGTGVGVVEGLPDEQLDDAMKVSPSLLINHRPVWSVPDVAQDSITVELS